jgi:hypothetical protein
MRTRRHGTGAAIVSAVVWMAVPAAWAVAAWALGPYLKELSLLVIPLALLGMAISFAVAGRLLLPSPVRLRRTTTRRRRLEPPARPARPELPLRVHALAGLLLAAMVLVAVAMVTVLPLACIWIASQLSSRTSPGTWPYLLIAAGTGAGAALGIRLLALLQRLHCEITGRPQSSRRSGWLRSLSDTDWVREPGAVVEWIVVVAVLVATVLLVVWLLVLADPMKLVPLQLQPP